MLAQTYVGSHASSTRVGSSTPSPSRGLGQWRGWLASLFTTVALAAALPAVAPAQYRVFDWINFDDGTLAPTIFLGHYAEPQLVKPLDLTSPGAPPGILDGIARTECGPFALAFEPTVKRPHMSIMSPLALDRNLLGTTGQALYQADFYLPPKGVVSPSTSLLAAFDSKGDRKAYHWYRFGMMPASNVVFFAFSDNTERPAIYHQLKIDQLQLKRPAWHRFQIIFEGRETIRCAIDANPVKFPEIREGTLTMLNAGIFVANTPNEEGKPSLPAIVDNVSIQYTPRPESFPDSPWTREDSAVADAPRAGASLLDRASGLNWMDNTGDAWAVARATQRPILVLWHIPRSNPYKYLESVMPNDPATRAALEKYVLLRIDANQLSGGFQAQKFNIVRLPTLMVLNSDGQVERKLPVIPNQTKSEAVSGFFAGG